jgi:hypothetical protein
MDGVIGAGVEDVGIEHDIARDEAWLRSMELDSPSPSFDRLKHAVQIAVQEQWFSAQLRDNVPDDLIPSVKKAVRDATRELRNPPRRQSRRVWLTWSLVSLSAAASFVLLVRVPSGVGSDVSESALNAFEQYELDDLSPSLALLLDDVASYELPMWSNVRSDEHDEQYDQILDLLDDVHSEGDDSEAS